MEYVTAVKNDKIDMSEGFLKLRQDCKKVYQAVDMAVAADFELFMPYSCNNTMAMT